MAAARSSGVEPGVAVVLPFEPLPLRLINTIWADRQSVHDTLATVDGLRTWLDATGLVAGTRSSHDRDGGADEAVVDEVGRLAAVRLRDGLRRLAALRTGDDRPAAVSPLDDLTEAVHVVNAAAAARSPASRIILVDGWLLRQSALPASDVDTALAVVATHAIDLLTRAGTVNDGDNVLRACHAPGCVLYFVRDHPRRQWCSTACGNRARAARHYRRHHPLAAARI